MILNVNKPILVIASVFSLCSCQKFLFWNKDADNAPVSFDVVGTGTRGSVTDVTSLQSSTFVVNAFLEASGRSSQDSSDPHYLKDVEFTHANSLWSSADTAASWRNKVRTNFWCHHPKTLTDGTRTITFPSGSSMSDSDQKSVTVAYTMPDPAGAGDDASLMDDLLFAYAGKTYDADDPGATTSVAIEFQHILSAVMFQAGTVLSGYDIKSVSLSGVLNSATCTLTGSGAGTTGISWGSYGTDRKSYTQNISLAALGSGAMTGTGDKVFWVIPQTTSATTSVRVVFTKDSKDIPVDVPLGTSTVWEAGKYYIYKISFDGTTVVASLTSGPVNWYNHSTGEWDENTSMDDYNQGYGGWGIVTTVVVPDLTNEANNW